MAELSINLTTGYNTASTDFTAIQKPPISKGTYVLAIYLVAVVGSYLPHSRSQSVAVTAILIFLFNQLSKTVWTFPGHAGADFGVLLQGLLPLLQWTDFYVIHSPSEFNRIKDGVKQPESFLGWLKWKLDLVTSRRGGGWNWEVKSLPHAQYRTKG